MPLMRDKQTGVIREVAEVTLRRWPEDYEPAAAARRPAAVKRSQSKGRKSDGRADADS